MKKLLAGICVSALAALACNFANQKLMPSSLSQSAIATIVAQTMQAVESAAPTASTVFNTPSLSMTPSPSATPMAVIQASTYCRSGPAETYKSITTVNPNQNAAVLGKDPSGNYWLIETSSGDCWVAAQYVAITGNTQAIPELTPPPLTPAGVPAEPGSLFYSYSCPSPTEATITLTWKDVANDESGYHVYRNGASLRIDLRIQPPTQMTPRGVRAAFSHIALRLLIALEHLANVQQGVLPLVIVQILNHDSHLQHYIV